MNEQTNRRTIAVVTPDKNTEREVTDMFKRVSATMSAFFSFSKDMADLDIDADTLDVIDAAETLHTRLFVTIMQIYPNPGQMEADIKTIGDFTIRG